MFPTAKDLQPYAHDDQRTEQGLWQRIMALILLLPPAYQGCNMPVSLKRLNMAVREISRLMKALYRLRMSSFARQARAWVLDDVRRILYVREQIGEGAIRRWLRVARGLPPIAPKHRRAARPSVPEWYLKKQAEKRRLERLKGQRRRWRWYGLTRPVPANATQTGQPAVHRRKRVALSPGHSPEHRAFQPARFTPDELVLPGLPLPDIHGRSRPVRARLKQERARRASRLQYVRTRIDEKLRLLAIELHKAQSGPCRAQAPPHI